MELPPIPPAIIRPTSVPSTNHYHLTFSFDVETNAAWYAIIVKKDGVEQFRRYSMTNFIVVSNLSSDLFRYSFTAIATNGLYGESDESTPAPKRLVTIIDQTRSLTIQPTNQSLFFTNLHPVSIINWSTSKELKKD